VLKGLENIQIAVDQVASGEPDAIMLMKGTAERCFNAYAGRIALIMKSSTLSPYHPEKDVWVNPVDDALRLGADAIAMAVTIGSAQQPEILADLAALVGQAEKAGIPLIAHAYPSGELVPPNEVYSAARVAYAARLVMELGVDIVKTFYTGSVETFAQVVEAAAPALVVAAGGRRLETETDAFQMAYDVLQAGAAGITFGRNIWQSGNTKQMICAMKHIVHENGSVNEAVTRFNAQNAD
jgi:DhnA family fructose-bisphosphate aldolase class Ia